jgi:hypothetical protein
MKCTYCGTENPGAGYKGPCPSCPANASQDKYEKSIYGVAKQLAEALEHTETRLNQIPHRYIDTDWDMIRAAKKAYTEYKK